MTSPFGGGGSDDIGSDELIDDLGEGEQDDTSDEAGAGGEEPATR